MPPSWRAARNLLCVRLDEMGDVLMTTPALRAVKGDVGRTITLLTSKAGAEIARFIPEIDDVIVHEAPWIKSAPPLRRAGDELAMADRLRHRRFDGALLFTVFSQNPLPAAYLCHLADIPLRAAYCRENPYQLLTHHLPEPDRPPHAVRHEVTRQLELAQALGFRTDDQRLSLRVPVEARPEGQRRLHAAGIRAGDPWILLHPGATAESRRYPPEHFAAAADGLVEAAGWDVVFTGSEEDVSVVEDVRRQMTRPSRSLAGKLSLDALLAVIERAPMLITNNTGPAHIAAALDTPVVVTYAQTNLQHTPWSDRARVLWHDVPCKFCLKSVCPEGHHACLRRVEPQAVVRAAMQLRSPPRAGVMGVPA